MGLNPRLDGLKTHAADAFRHRVQLWLSWIFGHRSFRELQRSQAKRLFLETAC